MIRKLKEVEEGRKKRERVKKKEKKLKKRIVEENIRRQTEMENNEVEKIKFKL